MFANREAGKSGGDLDETDESKTQVYQTLECRDVKITM